MTSTNQRDRTAPPNGVPTSSGSEPGSGCSLVRGPSSRVIGAPIARRPAASRGLAPSIPRDSTSQATGGVNTAPPTGRPTKTRDIATVRRRVNQSATRWLAGMTEVAANPAPISA